MYGCSQSRELWFIDFNHLHVYIYTCMSICTKTTEHFLTESVQVLIYVHVHVHCMHMYSIGRCYISDQTRMKFS